jgi:8-oxo-dGTP diphosphatase
VIDHPEDFGDEATPFSFPTVLWKREEVTFVVAATPEDGTPIPAALLFPFYGNRVVLADIVTRGWCIPSGHLEVGETAEDAVRREAFEEAGITMNRVYHLGYFVLTDTTTRRKRYAPTFIGDVRSMGEIPPGDESRGRQLVAIEDVASLYYSWDDLLSSVFAFAWRCKEEALSSGYSLAEFTELS